MLWKDAAGVGYQDLNEIVDEQHAQLSIAKSVVTLLLEDLDKSRIQSGRTAEAACCEIHSAPTEPLFRRATSR